MFIFPFDRIKSKCERKLSKQIYIRNVENVLEDDFPMCFYIFNSLFQIVSGVLSIIFQIISILNKSPLYEISAGQIKIIKKFKLIINVCNFRIWIGALMILLEIVCLFLSKINSIAKFLFTLIIMYYFKLNIGVINFLQQLH